MKFLRAIKHTAGVFMVITGAALVIDYFWEAETLADDRLARLIVGVPMIVTGSRFLVRWLSFNWLLGVALLALFVRLATHIRPMAALYGPPDLAAFSDGLFAVAALVLASIAFAPGFVEVASRPFVNFIDSIYFGTSRKSELPPLSLRLARAYRQDLRHADAISECERQLEYHPHSLELWTELIRSAQESGDADLVEKFHRRARRRLKREDSARLEREISAGPAWGGHGERKALRQP